LHGEFKFIQLNDNLTHSMKLGPNSPSLSKRVLSNVWDLTHTYMHAHPRRRALSTCGIVCHMLNVKPHLKYVAKKWYHQLPKKAEAMKTIIEGRPQSKFILEINYT